MLPPEARRLSMSERRPASFDAFGFRVGCVVIFLGFSRGLVPNRDKDDLHDLIWVEMQRMRFVLAIIAPLEIE
jgi:hypothetical protein